MPPAQEAQTSSIYAIYNPIQGVWSMPVDIDLATKIIKLLNELLAIDGPTVYKLIQARVQAGEGITRHPTVQVTTEGGWCGNCSAGAIHKVGLLGFLNGLCGMYDDEPRKGWGPIAMELDEDQAFIRRFRLLRPVVHVGSLPPPRLTAEETELCFYALSKEDYPTNPEKALMAKLAEWAAMSRLSPRVQGSQVLSDSVVKEMIAEEDAKADAAIRKAAEDAPSEES